MSPQAEVVIDDKDKPANIPDCLTIVEQCFGLGPKQFTDINQSGVRILPNKTSDHDVSNIWVKYRVSIAMSEAKTQDYVMQYLRERAPHVYLAFTWDGYGFIVSEYIDGPMCDNSDIPLVAAAVKALINIPSPDSRPGPVGGDLIEHPFCDERRSSIEYESIEELEDHINGILRQRGSIVLICARSSLMVVCASAYLT